MITQASKTVAVFMTALTFKFFPWSIPPTGPEIGNIRYENNTFDIIDDSTHPMNLTSPAPVQELFNNNVHVPSDGNINLVHTYTYEWTFQCLSMTSGLIHGFTEGFDKMHKKISHLENRMSMEHQKLHKKIELLRKGAPVPLGKSHCYNACQEQDRSQWTLFDNNTESINSIEGLLARFFVWMLMTAEIIICLFRQFRKNSCLEDNETSQLEELKELQQLRKEIKMLRKEFSERVSSIEKNNPSNPFPTPPPNSDQPSSSSSSSKSRRNKDNDDVLADFRAKLAQETAQIRRAQQDHYNSQMEAQKRKHEQDLKQREDRFRTMISDKLRMEKEEFLKWASNPD